MLRVRCASATQSAGLEAVVTQVVPARERVKILMDFLGRKVEAELEHDSVLLKVEHPLVA
jgi:hypothetical protein